MIMNTLLHLESPILNHITPWVGLGSLHLKWISFKLNITKFKRVSNAMSFKNLNDIAIYTLLDIFINK